MAMILQAAASLIGLADLAAAAAALALCALVLHWAFSACGSPPAPRTNLKIELIDTDALHLPPEPTDADLGLDFEAFQSSVERECDLALSRLCDDEVDGQVLRSLAEDLAGKVSFDQQVGCEGADSAPAGDPFAPHDGDLGLCFEALQAIQDDLKTLRTGIEQHCDLALESVLDVAIDGQYDIVLKNIEGQCGGPSSLDDETLEDTFDLDEMEEALSRQAEEARSRRADSPFNETFQEYHEQLLYEMEMVSQELPRKSLHEMIVQHIRRARGMYLLWII